jgi:DNA-binding transcriptional regulator LsrR (DeoR family)
MYCIIASMDYAPITPSYVVNKLGVSRNAVDTMIQECEKNEWIIVDRDERDYRTMYSTVFMQEAYMEYAEWVSKTCADLGFADIQGAIKLLQSTTK